MARRLASARRAARGRRLSPRPRALVVLPYVSIVAEKEAFLADVLAPMGLKARRRRCDAALKPLVRRQRFCVLDAQRPGSHPEIVPPLQSVGRRVTFASGNSSGCGNGSWPASRTLGARLRP
mmetsp:Transcript_9398/g.22627  ORF Transcript_9398/g.22627 Transcript_9398/m.22627 type:complete len:122 (-) Transcript_9398:371-736(-)